MRINRLLKKSFRKTISAMLAALMGISLAMTGVEFCSGEKLVMEANAATVAKTPLDPSTPNFKIVNNAAKYLGCGYSNAVNQGPDTFDCTGLIYKVMNESGFSGVPTYTIAWLDAIRGKTLNMSYNGKALSTIYVDTVDAYYNAINDNANKGKIVVLHTARDWNQLAKKGCLEQGTICITPKVEGGADHGSIIVGSIPSVNAPKNYMEWYDSSIQYQNQAMQYVKNNYPLCSKRTTVGITYFPECVTSPHSAINRISNDILWGQYNAKPGPISLYIGGGLDAYGNGNLGSDVWRIDAASIDMGVRLCNLVGGSAGAVNTYAVTYVQGNKFAKVSMISQNQACKRVGAAVYAVLDSQYASCSEAVVKGKIDKILSTYSAYADRKKAIEQAFPGAQFIKTFEGADATTNVIKVKGNLSTVTKYLVEIVPPAGYLRDSGLYKIVLSTTNNASGKGSVIQSLTNPVAGAYGSSMVVYKKGTSTTLGVLAAKNYTYYGRLAFKKTDDTGAAVPGAVYLMITTAKGAGIVGRMRELKESYGTPRFQTLLDQMNDEILIKSTSGVTYTPTISMGASATKTYYMMEIYTPVGYAADQNIYRITLKGTKDNGTGVGSTASCAIHSGKDSKISVTPAKTAKDTTLIKATDPKLRLGIAVKSMNKSTDQLISGGAGYVVFRNQAQAEAFVAARDQYLAKNGAATRSDIYKALINNGNDLRQYMMVLNAYSSGTASKSMILNGPNSNVNADGTGTAYMVQFYAPAGYSLGKGYVKFDYKAGGKADGSDTVITAANYVDCKAATQTSLFVSQFDLGSGVKSKVCIPYRVEATKQ